MQQNYYKNNVSFHTPPGDGRRLYRIADVRDKIHSLYSILLLLVILFIGIRITSNWTAN